MIDKNKYTSFIKDEETKLIMIKNMSKIQGVQKHFDIRKTDFMNPYEQKVFISILNAFSDEISYKSFGGSEDSERKLFVIYPNYILDIEIPIKLLRLYGNFKFEKISHRDCLGALMSVGIGREKIGDIYVGNDSVDIVIDEDIDNYISQNISSIRHTSVKAKILDITDIVIVDAKTTSKIHSVSSLRIDNIIAEAFNLSRAMATNIVKANRVKVDYEPILNPAKNIEKNSLISVKGYGRVKFISEEGISKKGKYRIKLEFFE